MKIGDDIASSLGLAKPKNKEPRNRSVLDSWIACLETEINPSRSGRLAWLIASTVVTAKLQSVIDLDGKSRFSLKGGTLLQHRLGLISRATGDLDGIVCGDIDDFLRGLDSHLQEDWGTISFSRTEVELINTPAKIIKPRRFEMILSIKGQTWRRVVVEMSANEGLAGFVQETFEAPNLAPFGLPTPDFLVGMAMSYQIAQKIHAATDPHDPPKYVNRRARDVVDLVLIKDFVEIEKAPSERDIKVALVDIFTSRADEARTLGRTPRHLPAKVTAYSHWEHDYAEAAQSCGLGMSLDEAVSTVNSWIKNLVGSIGFE